ncbi:MAG: hypothetical protein JWM27_60 [Gemmatimonadetes bacterium]|nr:hypothetical protein [Gemmatimonadota bacterium]
MRHPAFAAALLAVIAATGADAQQPARYRAAPDTTFVQTINPYHLYWVRGGDTIGKPTREVSVERQVWRDAGDHLDISTSSMRLDVARTIKEEALAIAPDGRVLRIAGARPTSHGRIDFALHLPPRLLAAGVRWRDTVEGTGPGTDFYRVERSYEVARMRDTLGTRVADVRATGSVAFRQQLGEGLGMDVTGPVAERYLFDVRGGRLLFRRWDMDLRGVGTVPREKGGVDSLRAGLRSVQEETAVSAELGRLMTRDVAGADTTATPADRAAYALHVATVAGDTVRSALALRDGTVGTVTMRYRAGRPVSYQALWTDPAGSTRRQVLDMAGRGLIVVGGPDDVPAYTDTAKGSPARDWAVADVGMDELPGPVLVALPADSAPRRLAIYRPLLGRWDTAGVTVRRLPGGIAARIVAAGGPDATTRGFGDDSVLLFATADDPYRRLRGGKTGSRVLRRLQEMRPATDPGGALQRPRGDLPRRDRVEGGHTRTGRSPAKLLER